jgi:uncharacterized protein (TIGR02147 family)
MTTSVFEFEDYKAFLLACIESAPNSGRGVRRELADFAGCQVAYVSHVLAGERHFNLEQAEAAARFFALRDDETEFFFLLVERQRAGTPELRRNLNRRIQSRRTDYREIKKRIRITKSISSADQALYYSSWHYQAVHSLLSIPDYQQSAKIATRLNLPTERVSSILEFLLDKGLIRETSNGYQSTETQIHLPRTSPLIAKLHSNWRVQTLSALENLKDDDYHYSGLVSLSAEDVSKVREIMTKALASSIEVVKPSREEKLCVLAMDFYEL